MLDRLKQGELITDCTMKIFLSFLIPIVVVDEVIFRIQRTRKRPKVVLNEKPLGNKPSYQPPFLFYALL